MLFFFSFLYNLLFEMDISGVKGLVELLRKGGEFSFFIVNDIGLFIYVCLIKLIYFLNDVLFFL